MTKEPFPRPTDSQFADALMAAAAISSNPACCLVCNEIISVHPAPKKRMEAMKLHEEESSRHNAFISALAIDPEETL